MMMRGDEVAASRGRPEFQEAKSSRADGRVLRDRLVPSALMPVRASWESRRPSVRGPPVVAVEPRLAFARRLLVGPQTKKTYMMTQCPADERGPGIIHAGHGAVLTSYSYAGEQSGDFLDFTECGLLF